MEKQLTYLLEDVMNELINYLMENFGIGSIADADPVTAEIIMGNVEAGMAEPLDVMFKTEYLKLHNMNTKMSMVKFRQTKLFTNFEHDLMAVA